MPPVILVVEDEKDLARALAWNLQKEGFTPVLAPTGAAALAAVDRDPVPDLVLLDLVLPDLPGTELCRRFRSDPRTRAMPIVMLTARAEEIDRVVGFELGADDYVTKPFSMRELLLRLRAVLRRAAPGEERAASLRVGRLRIDGEAHRVWIDDEEIELTPLEFRMVQAFAATRGRVRSREALIADVWGPGTHLDERTVDTHVKRLRRKLGPVGAYIETLRGVGYRFQEPAG